MTAVIVFPSSQFGTDFEQPDMSSKSSMNTPAGIDIPVHRFPNSLYLIFAPPSILTIRIFPDCSHYKIYVFLRQSDG